MRKLLGNRVLIEKEEKKTKSGIIIPGQTEKDFNKGIVIAVGEDVDSSLVGKRVLYMSYLEVKIEPFDLEKEELEDPVLILDGNIEMILHKFKVGDNITTKPNTFPNGGNITGVVKELISSEEEHYSIELTGCTGIELNSDKAEFTFKEHELELNKPKK